jgi:hypothetical protein
MKSKKIIYLLALITVSCGFYGNKIKDYKKETPPAGASLA